MKNNEKKIIVKTIINGVIPEFTLRTWRENHKILKQKLFLIFNFLFYQEVLSPTS